MTVAASTGSRALVAGWFSFTGTGATVGDLMAKTVVCSWLERAGVPYDVAIAPAFGTGMEWRDVDPDRYTHVVFVCGPFFRSNLLRRFEGSRLLGVNLSMIEPVGAWNPFDLLLERDSEQTVRPDIAFAAPSETVPVVGFVPLPTPDADRGRERSDVANGMLRGLLASRHLAVAPIDTRLEARDDGFSASPARIESMIRRVDVVVTARLHGLVLSLRNGVPALALDPVDGGGKIMRQAAAVGWPAAMHVGEANSRRLDDALDFCLSNEAAVLARERGLDAAAQVDQLGGSFAKMLGPGVSGPAWGDGRRRREWVSYPTRTDRTSGFGRARARVRRGIQAGIRSADRAIHALERRL